MLMYINPRLENMNSVFRHNGGPMKGPPYAAYYDTGLMVPEVLGGPRMGPHGPERCQSLGQILRLIAVVSPACCSI